MNLGLLLSFKRCQVWWLTPPSGPVTAEGRSLRGRVKEAPERPLPGASFSGPLTSLGPSLLWAPHFCGTPSSLSFRFITSVGCRLVSALQCINVTALHPRVLICTLLNQILSFLSFFIPKLVHNSVDLKCVGPNRIKGSITDLGLRF